MWCEKEALFSSDIHVRIEWKSDRVVLDVFIDPESDAEATFEVTLKDVSTLSTAFSRWMVDGGGIFPLVDGENSTLQNPSWQGMQIAPKGRLV